MQYRFSISYEQLLQTCMFPVPVEMWGSAPPAAQLRLKEARREHLLRSHGISRYSDIIQQDLYRWREVNNSPKFSSLPSALEEEEREREMQKVLQSSRRKANGNGLSTKAKLKDIWKKILPTIIGGNKKSREKFPSEPDIQDQDGSGSSESPTLREPEKSILNRDRRNDAPKKFVRWADESDDSGKSPRNLNLATIDEESGVLHHQVGELAFEEPDPYIELDEDEVRARSEHIDRHILRHPETWPPHPGMTCSHILSSLSDSELTRHTTAGCPCCDERQAILAKLCSPDTFIRSPDAGFHSPESAATQSSAPRTPAECQSSANALAIQAAASLPSSSGTSSFTNTSSDSPSSFLPVKLPRLASTPSLLPSQLNDEPLVVSCSGVRHRTVTYASVRHNITHTAAHP